MKSRLSACFALVIFSASPLICASADENASQFPKILEVGEGMVDFGGILIDRVKRRISFSATCNQTSGLVEYGLVHENGKVHESLFRTSVRPRWIHACLLLLKLSPNPQILVKGESGEELAMNPIEGGVGVGVSWDENGTTRRKGIEAMIVNRNSDRLLAPSPFVFIGSRTIQGEYLAETEGSILAVFRDPNAVLTNVDSDSWLDDVWLAEGSEMPPKEREVEITFQLPPVRSGL